MASTLTKLLIHVTFSTKSRAALIPEAIEPDLYAYIGGICRRMESPLLAMGGVPDHVYMLMSLSKTVTVSDLMLNVKRDTSKWMKETQGLSAFAWQDGYFAFSIGESGVVALQEYIANQKKHHQAVSYMDEVRTFLRKYGISWDERYVWD
jgi:REP element-mobilizing transposase RayT